MSARDQFFQYLGLSGATLIGLFVVQGFVQSYLDVSYHAEIKTLGSHEVVDQARADEAAKLSGIDAAMAKLAKGRSADALIVPRASDDVSAMSGWVHHPDFVIYEPAAPSAAPPAAVPSTVVPAAPAPSTGAPTPAAAPTTSARPVAPAPKPAVPAPAAPAAPTQESAQ